MTRRYHVERMVRPSLVRDYLAIEDHLRTDARLYDFMAGEGQHYQSLNTDLPSVTWLVLQRDRLKVRVENSLHRWKHRLAQ